MDFTLKKGPLLRNFTLNPQKRSTFVGFHAKKRSTFEEFYAKPKKCPLLLDFTLKKGPLLSDFTLKKVQFFQIVRDELCLLIHIPDLDQFKGGQCPPCPPYKKTLYAQKKYIRSSSIFKLIEHKRSDSVLINDNLPPMESGYITATLPLGLPRNNTVLSIAETPWTLYPGKYVESSEICLSLSQSSSKNNILEIFNKSFMYFTLVELNPRIF